MIRGIHGALTRAPRIYGALPRAPRDIYGAPPRTPLRTFFEKKVLRTPKNF